MGLSLCQYFSTIITSLPLLPSHYYVTIRFRIIDSPRYTTLYHIWRTRIHFRTLLVSFDTCSLGWPCTAAGIPTAAVKLWELLSPRPGQPSSGVPALEKNLRYISPQKINYTNLSTVSIPLYELRRCSEEIAAAAAAAADTPRNYGANSRRGDN